MGYKFIWMRLFKTVLILGFLVSTLSVASTITEVVVEGNRRIEADAIINKMKSKPQTVWDDAQIAADIKSVYELGYFDDVEMRLDNDGKLVVRIQERPQVKDVGFSGNSASTDDDLKEIIKVKTFDIYNFGKVQEDIRALQKHYEDKGFYLARINPIVTFVDEKKKDQVQLVYDIQEFERVRIRRITFMGNKVFKDEALKAFMMSKEGSFFTGFSPSAAAFKDSIFKDDLERMKWFYSTKGYVRFQYDPPTIQVTEDRRWVDITVSMEEGKQYFAGKIEFHGDLLFSEEDLASSIKLRTGDVFSQAVVRDDITVIQDKYGDLGYAFANIIPKPLINDEKLIVDLIYEVEKGEKVYFGEINITGNNKTRDKVIRRELRIVEGELYHGTRLKKSKENVERLGYFEQGVVFNTASPKNQPQVLDVEIQVKERPTGTFVLSAGYGNVQKFIIGSNIKHSNFLGRGQTIEASSQLSLKKNGDREFKLGFEEPYLFDTEWSFGVDLFQNQASIPEFISQTTGTSVSFGHPLEEYTRGYLSYEIERTYLKYIFDPEVQNNPEVRKEEEGISSSATASIVRDTRSNRFEPLAGSYFRLYNTFAGLGGNKNYNQAGSTYSWYWTPFWDFTFRNRYEFGALMKTEAGKPIPRSRLFRPAGYNALRGYDFDQIGPRVVDESGVTRYLGGKYQAFTQFELEFPVIKEAGPLKWVFFYDVGNSFGYFPANHLKEARHDWGFGIRWFSPIGPLRFEWAYPIGKGSSGLGSQFIFSIGPPF